MRLGIAPPTPELSVVVPVRDEQAAIRTVVESWCDVLATLEVTFELRVYDDGSRDRTPDILRELAVRHPELVIVRHVNRGHGPTILRGYHEARGAWVLQIDGDDEMPADVFPAFWARRHEADLLLAQRTGRRQSPVRRLITLGSWLTVRVLFGRGIGDVNVPYRLYRRALLETLLREIPAETFAPNLALTGLALRRGARVVEMTVPHRGRRTTTSSLGTLQVCRAAARALGQTMRLARSRGSQPIAAPAAPVPAINRSPRASPARPRSAGEAASDA